MNLRQFSIDLTNLIDDVARLRYENAVLREEVEQYKQRDRDTYAANVQHVGEVLDILINKAS